MTTGAPARDVTAERLARARAVIAAHAGSLRGGAPLRRGGGRRPDDADPGAGERIPDRLSDAPDEAGRASAYAAGAASGERCAGQAGSPVALSSPAFRPRSPATASTVHEHQGAARLRRTKRSPATASAVHALPAPERVLGGGWLETAHGPAFVRDRWFAPEHRHGDLPLAAALDLDPGGLSCLLAGPGAHGGSGQSAEGEQGAGGRTGERGGGDGIAGARRSRSHPQASSFSGMTETATAAPDPRTPASGIQRRLGFFDIETTGLGGGAGTYVFLAGLGTFEDDGFRLRQYFLADVAGERAMLSLLADDLARCDALVTYNGRAFDLPMVQTRLTLSRLRSPCASLSHFDLLHPMRRLYRHRLPSCRLADAERRLLGIARFDDTPGSLMPAIYFEYVRAGRTAPLRGVFQHNADDVLSLVGLLARLAALFSSADPSPDDAAALARWWEREGELERARALYRRALPWLEGGDDWTWAAHRHARLSRRAGDHDEAAALWRALWAQGDATAGLALAKHLEHRAREYAGAADLTRALLARGAQDAGALRSRLARIEGKIARCARAGAVRDE